MKTALNNTEIVVRPATPGQMKDIYSMMIQAVPTLSFEQATLILRNKKAQIEKIAGTFPKHEAGSDVLKNWEHFYREVFGLNLDLSGVQIPDRREGFDRLIVIAVGLTLNQAYAACKKHFPCSKYANDLDVAVPTNDRATGQSYAIWVRDTVEADEEHANRSADDLKKSGVKGETLLERMVHEIKYFLETGKHLDIDNVTLCSGSRGSGDLIPDASWTDGTFFIYWSYGNDRDSRVRCREAVSL